MGKQILRELRTRYDYEILDGPHVLTLEDVNALGGLADQVILVIRASLTSGHSIQGDDTAQTR